MSSVPLSHPVLATPLVMARAGFKCVKDLGRIIRGQSGGVLVWLSVWSKVQTTLKYDLGLYISSYDLHAIFIPDYQFQKVFLCFLG